MNWVRAKKCLKNGNCKLYEDKNSKRIIDHPLKDEIIDKIKSGKITFS